MQISSKNFLGRAILAMTCLLSPALAEEKASPLSFRIGLGLAGEYTSLSAGFKEHFGGNLQAGNHGNSSHAAKTVMIAPVFEMGVFIHDKFYLGLLASWHYCHQSHKSRSYFARQYFFTHELEMSSYTTVLFKAGYKITKGIMAYGLVGPSLARWKHTSIQHQRETVRDTFTMKKNSLGLTLGGGIEFEITNASALSIDYTHTLYRRHKASQTVKYTAHIRRRLIERSGPLTKSIRPSHDTLSLKYTYFF